ncbi:hypothetical protein LSH36_655g00000 [Paralvinella palmiformis]|uniref:SWIM-type domain-containing protein n=1 Tax=Paralvinella palmiformis TaxID=53620 RepID=A0AAD9J466_9ANNE|nr:hypothetical protein LSH36_655g00000 [Paralvinella palmiformis]
METDVTKQLFIEVSQTYKEEGTYTENCWKFLENIFILIPVTNSVLSALQFVFQTPLLPALDLLDNNKIKKIISPSGRCVFQVLGSSGTPYICLSVLTYCSCAAFRFSVLRKRDYILCKHLLAIKLGLAMEKVKEQEVTDEVMTDIIKHIE